jgi:hypothetical protein
MTTFEAILLGMVIMAVIAMMLLGARDNYIR